MLFRFTTRTIWDVVRTTQPTRSYDQLLQSTPRHPHHEILAIRHFLVRWS